MFLAAASGGDMTSLLERLAPDVVFYGDSGGRGETTFIAPVFGRDQVAEVVLIQVERTLQLGASLRPTRVNGQPGVLACDAEDGLIAVIAFDVADGQIRPSDGREPGEAAPHRPGLAHLAPALARAGRRKLDRPCHARESSGVVEG